MKQLLSKIRTCDTCSASLPLGPKPVLAAHPESRVVIIGQAPGSVVHNSGVPWDDKSGDNLREWLQLDRSTFYNPEKLALVPMGFCYPGTGKSGDLPPRKECAPLWHNQLLHEMKNVRLILLIGKYAQDYYLQGKGKSTLTETVRSYQSYLPTYFVLPHPSPRNNIWQKKNPWFKAELLNELRKAVTLALN